MDDDDDAVAMYLSHLRAEREKKEEKKDKENKTFEKQPSWVSLHMTVAEKRDWAAPRI